MKSFLICKKIKSYILSALLIVFCACLFIGVKPLVVGAEYKFNVSDLQIKDEYVVGESIEAPSANFSIGEKTFDAKAILYYPSGTAKKINAVVLNEPGLYTLSYQAVTESNELLREDFSFKVKDSVYSISSLSGSVEYGLDQSQYQTGHTGLTIKFTGGDKFTYHKAINLNDLHGQNIIEAFVIPNESRKRDFKIVKFRFTDVYDETNYVIVRAKSLEPFEDTDFQRTNTALDAGVSESIFCGFDEESRTYYVNHSSNYGYFQSHSFSDQSANTLCGTKGCQGASYSNTRNTTNTELNEQGMFVCKYCGSEFDFSSRVNATGKGFIRFGLDLEDKCVKEYFSDGSSAVICDLTNPNVFTNKLFTGFTTGEVILSIEVEDIVGESACIMVTDIAGYDLSQKEFEGGNIPSILVDYIDDSYVENPPKAIVGLSYPIFNATATDFDKGVIDAKVQVWYDYKYEHRFMVNVENGMFVPDRAGDYTIVYYTVDGFGHYIKKEINVKAENELPIISSPLQSINANVGKYFSIPELTNLQGGSGLLEVEKKIKLPSGEEVAADGNTYLPMQVGEYTIIYLVNDYVGQIQMFTTKVIVGSNGENAIFGDESFPKYLLEGHSYQLPSLDSYNFDDGSAKKISTLVKVDDADGLHEINIFEKYLVKGKDGKVVFYYYAGTDSDTMKAFEIPVLNVGTNNDLNVKNYFVSDTMDINYYNNDNRKVGVEFVAKQDNGEVEFINPIVANNFSINFAFDGVRNNMKKAVIKLYDSVDRSICVKIELSEIYKTEWTGAKVLVPGLRAYINDIELNTNISTGFNNTTPSQLSYSSNKSITIGATTGYILYDTLGREFNGFPSGYVNFTIGLEGVTGDAAIILTGIQNQQMREDIKKDTIAPSFSLMGDYTKRNKIGSRIKIIDVYVSDVLDSNFTKLVSVYGPNNVVIKDVNGVALLNVVPSDQEFVLDDYGTYTIKYTIKDSVKTSGLNLSISANDDEGPEITLNEPLPNEVTKGSSLTLPTATIDDNIDDESSLILEIYVLDPDQKYYCIKGTNLEKDSETVSYTFEKIGNYRIIYMVKDSFNNLTIVENVVKSIERVEG